MSPEVLELVGDWILQQTQAPSPDKSATALMSDGFPAQAD
jgi:hypothetical protein